VSIETLNLNQSINQSATVKDLGVPERRPRCTETRDLLYCGHRQTKHKHDGAVYKWMNTSCYVRST